MRKRTGFLLITYNFHDCIKIRIACRRKEFDGRGFPRFPAHATTLRHAVPRVAETEKSCLHRKKVGIGELCQYEQTTVAKHLPLQSYS